MAHETPKTSLHLNLGIPGLWHRDSWTALHDPWVPVCDDGARFSYPLCSWMTDANFRAATLRT
jgi:hypothetical protein